MDKDFGRRRENDPRIDRMEKDIQDIEENVIAGKNAFIEHEARGIERQKEIQNELAEIKASLAEIKSYKEIVTRASALAEKHEELLYGDGESKPGIIIKIDRLSFSIDDVKNVLNDLKKVGWLVFASFITAGIGLLINAIIHAAAAK